MKRAVVVIECDNCHKTVETETAEDLPLSWAHLTLATNGDDAIAIDVDSPGCAERALIHLIRQIFDVPEEVR